MSSVNASWGNAGASAAPSSSSSGSNQNNLSMLVKTSGGGGGGVGLGDSSSSLHGSSSSSFLQNIPSPSASVFGNRQIAPDKLSAVAMLAAKMKKSSSSSKLGGSGSGSTRNGGSRSGSGSSNQLSSSQQKQPASDASTWNYHMFMPAGGNGGGGGGGGFDPSLLSPQSPNGSNGKKTTAVAEELLRLSASLERHDAENGASFDGNNSNSSMLGGRSQSSNSLSNAFLVTDKKMRGNLDSQRTHVPKSSSLSSSSSQVSEEDGLKLSSSMSNFSSKSKSKTFKKSTSSGKLKKSGSSTKVSSDSVNFLRAASDNVKAGLNSDRWKSVSSSSSSSQQQQQPQKDDMMSTTNIDNNASALLSVAKRDPEMANKLMQLASKQQQSTGSFKPSKAMLAMAAEDDDGGNGGYASFSTKKPRRKLRKETLQSLGLGMPPSRSADPTGIDGLGGSSSMHGLFKTPSKSCLKSSTSSNSLRRAVSMVQVTLPSKKTVKRENFIKFNELVEVKRVASSSNLGTDKKELWFQKDEMNQIRQDSKRLVDLLDESTVDPNLVDIRGLEEHRKMERKKSKERIYGGWDAVLDAQDEQRYTGNYSMEEIASLARRHSKNSLKDAQLKAQKDAADAAATYISSSRFL